MAKILGILWKDKRRNEEVRKRTGMDTLENTKGKDDCVGLAKFNA